MRGLQQLFVFRKALMTAPQPACNSARQQGQQLQSLLSLLHRAAGTYSAPASHLNNVCMLRCCCCCRLSPAPLLLQAALHDVVCVGVTPRELSMMALSALTAWRSSSSQQQSGLLPQHLAGSIRGWMAQHDSRVSGQCSPA